jgi:phage terminase large subunit-like protein
VNFRYRKQAACLSIFAVGLLSMTGCGGQSHEAITDSMMTSMDKFADILASVKDEASAKAAVSQLDNLTASVKELAEKAKALGDPPKEIQTKIEEKMKAKQSELQQKMNASMMNLMSNPALMQIITPALTKFAEAMGPGNLGNAPDPGQ